MEVFEGKALYFCGGGGCWLFCNPGVVVFCENVIFLGGYSSHKCSSVCILSSNEILCVVWV